MPLTILNVAYPYAPVGPDAVGGSEQILSALDIGITCAGHHSVVVAQQGSQTAGVLIAVNAHCGHITSEVRAWTAASCQHSIDEALRNFCIDLVHFHDMDFHLYHTPHSIPSLATLHLPASWYPRKIWEQSYTTLQCVSHTQRKTLPSEWQTAPVIANGVFREEAVLHLTRRNYALALGRICAEKNFHAALDAGTQAEIPVWIGGQVYPYREHQSYFEQQITPRLQHGHRFLGPLNASRKKRLLAAAKCLLIPSLAPETSSLVAMEALSTGTPVIAFPSGALPEIIQHGITGFLVHNQREMAAAIRHVHEISSDGCQREAKERFSQRRMIEEYLSLYAALVGRSNHAVRLVR